MKNVLPLLFWGIVLGGVLNWYISSSPVSPDNKQKLQEIYATYLKGEIAQTVGDRQRAFNAALNGYALLEREYRPVLGNGKLYYNIANSYYQLGEYPFAVLYYYKALSLRPRDEKVSGNLAIALNKLGLKPQEEESVFRRVFFFHFFAQPERLQLFFAFSLLAVAAASFYIWFRQRLMLKLSCLGATLCAVILFSLAFTHYVSPVEAVLVRSSSLYRDAGYHYAKVMEDPLLSGLKVEVLDVLQEGNWLKVATPEGTLGYVPHKSARLIQEE